MLKADAVIEKLGGAGETAKFFDITVQAVSQWRRRKQKCIPRERELELMLRRPADFPPEHNGNGKKAA